MKHLIVILTFAPLVISSSDFKIKNPEDLMRAKDDCIKEKNMSQDHIDQFKKSQYPEDQLTRCFAECMLTKLEFFDTNKGFMKTNINRQLGPKGYKSIEGCLDKNEEKTDSCKWAFRGFKCIMDKNLFNIKDNYYKLFEEQ